MSVAHEMQSDSDLNPAEVEKLLGQLCVDLGFCSPPDAHVRLLERRPGTYAKQAG